MQYAYPLLAIFIWAGNTVINKLAVGTIFPSEIGFYRWLLAGLLFTPFMLKPIVANWSVIRPNLGKIFVLGVGRHPDRVLRRRHKAPAIDFKAHHTVGHIIQ